MPVETIIGEGLDGRQSRTARSRRAICEACLGLIQEGQLQPSADEVAARAGVSRRSIYNHFADLAELYDATVEIVTQRFVHLRAGISTDEPIASRVEHLVKARSKFLEATSPFSRALTAQALVGPGAEEAIRVSRNALKHHCEDIEKLFGSELAGLSSIERTDVFDAMTTTMAPVVWEHLRRTQGRSVARASAVMKRSLTAVLRDVGVEF